MALNPYTGQITQGLRGNLGGENAFWGIDPNSGKEVPVLYARGGDGQPYLLSDLMQQYGSIDGIRQAGRAQGYTSPGSLPDYTENPNPYYGAGAFEQSLDLFGARPSNDTFSGKDGLNDLITIGAMAAPVIGGALGAAGATTSGAAAGSTAAGDAAIAGGSGTDALASGSTASGTTALGSQGGTGMWDWLDQMDASGFGGDFSSDAYGVSQGPLDTSGFGGDFSADAYGGAQTQGGTMMPPAVPETDPTFGGVLNQTGPGEFGTPDLSKISPTLLQQIGPILSKLAGKAGAAATGGAAGGFNPLQTAFNSAPFLLALAEANRQSGDLNGVISKINSGYTDSVLHPYDQETGVGRTNMLQDLSLRGVSGSSFGNQQVGNYDYLRALGRGDLASKASLASAGLEGNLINTRNTNRNMLLGAGLNASAKLFSPQSDPFNLQNLLRS